MGIKQYKVGKTFEEEVISLYNNLGYWCYKVPTVNSGTIFDIIAMRNNTCILIECKHTESDILRFRCGLDKKKDELNHFESTTGNKVLVYIKSDKLNSIYWILWKQANEIFNQRNYIDLEKDCQRITKGMMRE